MKTGKKLLSVWLITLGFSLWLYGANPEKPISLQIENLTQWKNSSEALAIQQGLGAILKPRREYMRSAESLKEIQQYVSIFKKPFLLLDAEPTDFGGFFALIIFQNTSKVLRVWIHEIDKNVFEIREVTPLHVTLNKEIINELEDKRITPFWLTALTP